jgi:hypothetical protein
MWASLLDDGDYLFVAADTARRVESSCKLVVSSAAIAIVRQDLVEQLVSEIVAGFAAVAAGSAVVFEDAQHQHYREYSKMMGCIHCPGAERSALIVVFALEVAVVGESRREVESLHEN